MTFFELFLMPVELFKIAFAIVFWAVACMSIYEFVFKWIDLDSAIKKIKQKWRH
jgi:predicted nucleotidyltransferase